MSEGTKGPFIVWQNYGCEGWKPESFQTLKEAVLAQKYGNEWVLTEAVDIIVSRERLAADFLNS